MATAAVILKPSDKDVEPSEEMLQVAETIKERYATSPDLANFCEAVSDFGNPKRWTQRFEPHVRHILDVNQDRFVLCSAHFALAAIVRSGGIERQEEAKNVYEEFLAEFSGEVQYPGQSVEQHNRQSAKRVLDVIKLHGLGKKAAETKGIDLEGNAVSLSDYRGRVVLLSFWATWCGPCLGAIPHERDLVERFDSADFAILGMNADDETDEAVAAVEKYEVTWRSLHLNDRRTVNPWKVSGYPTFILVDREGIIVQSWMGLPPGTELETTIRNVISEAGGR
ncbi:Thiol-disulfide oxidoreductase ResA [Roseimaritima ulvae]|uniref:Thiol-disulfide oxidoreductase ResA n=2 Tax=Roseimaritima ulvae TaxID=980254 RepID=A0A5B9QRW2_9BACT|nr:Thiol-disulfide oxidoreductase ResA [Roseimaritima ulvae]